MRVWNEIHPSRLCRKHLLGEHVEIHAIWKIIHSDGPGYKNHPEVKRWVGNEYRLHLRHWRLVKEMRKRGYNHKSPLDGPKYAARRRDPESWDDQEAALSAKGCDCEAR
jgi:hypothetical protein